MTSHLDVTPYRLVITGGSGFMGTNAVEHFVHRGYEVLNIDVRPPRHAAHRSSWTECDILDAKDLKRVFATFSPHFVLHLAARTDLHEKHSLSGYSANIEGVQNLIEATSKSTSLRRVIVASSRMVCRIGYQPKGDDDYCPPNLYGESKVRTEELVRSAGLVHEWIIVRPTSIWGPWFEVPYRDFFTMIQRGRYFHPDGANPVKSFGYIGNTVHQLERLMLEHTRTVHGRTFYLCDYPPLHLREWAEMIRQAMDRPPIRSLSTGLLGSLARVGDIFANLGWHRVPITTFRLGNLLRDMTYDTTLLEQICGPLPYTLEEGTLATVAWMTTGRFEPSSKTAPTYPAKR